MTFKKRETAIPTTAPVSEQARPYLEHKKRITELDFTKANDVDIALYCLRVNPVMAKDLNLSVERELDILKIWIKRDYSNYLLCVKNEVDHIDLLTLYLTEKFTKTHGAANADVALLTSYDKKLVINYQYETKRGETISYFDKALGVPTSLVVKANLKLKLADAQKLVEKIDVDIKYVDMNIAQNFITSVLNGVVRDTILSFISKQGLTFYDLPQYYTLINQGILNNLRQCFDASGLEATEFCLLDIAVPNNTGTMLQNQFFAIAEAERVKEYEQRVEKASLELYERKAAIHNKYPDFPITLTEAEKDFALDRYLKRMGKDLTLKADILQQEIDERKIVNDGTATVERKIIAPTFIKKSNTFRTVYAIASVILFIIAISMFALSVQAGLIALACVTFAVGITGFCFYGRIKYGSKTKQLIDADYNREGNVYVKQQVESEQQSQTETVDGANQNVSDDE